MKKRCKGCGRKINGKVCECSKQCDSCGEMFPFKKMIHGPDPFVAEIYGTEKAKQTSLCQKCYEDTVLDT
ncbi:MAG: hypothetical protein DWQ19_10015 [Crenarchaeota archaeon]|nr:MAG: hypothetical protein DWQ19_10015 [Thermoproteota archaeon]